MTSLFRSFTAQCQMKEWGDYCYSKMAEKE